MCSPGELSETSCEVNVKQVKEFSLYLPGMGKENRVKEMLLVFTWLRCLKGGTGVGNQVKENFSL